MTPFALNHYHLIPIINMAIAAHRLDAIVFGLGPTAQLLPYLDQSYVRDCRLVTSHDGGQIIPVDDVLILDPPERALAVDGPRFAAIHACRPKRIFVLSERFAVWKEVLHPAVHAIMQALYMKVHSPTAEPGQIATLGPEFITAATFPLEDELPHTGLISPVAAITHSWRSNGRRIGVLGVDMLPGQHHTGHPFYVDMVDKIMCVLAEQAEAAGGCIVNLSPITSLKNFATRSRYPQ